MTLRHRLFDWGLLKSEKFDIPVVCIGNITVGGTGKTPMAEMVVGYMSQTHRVALLSRGYGRRTKGYREVSCDSHYRDVGDEPLQIKLKFPETVVAVCEKRAEASAASEPNTPGWTHRHGRRLPAPLRGAEGQYRDDRRHAARAARPHAAAGDAARSARTVAPCALLHRHEVPRADGADRPPHPAQGPDPGGLPAVYFTRFESFMPQPLFPDARPANRSCRDSR